MGGDDKTHIRRLLEKATKRPIPDEMWLDLEARRFVDDAGDEDGWSNLVEEARRLFRFMELGARGGAVHRPPTASGRGPILARARAFSALVALRVDKRPELMGFREWWGGGYLRPEEALERIHTPGWTLVPLDDLWGGRGRRPFQSGDAEFIRHHASRIVSEEPEDLKGHPGTRWTVELSHDGEARRHSFWVNPAANALVSVAVPGADPAIVFASLLSLVGGLGRLAEVLQGETPWSAEDAAWFALTGQPPRIEPLLLGTRRWRDRGYSRVVVKLEVEPWVPHDAVLAAYRQAQREVLPGPNRPIHERSAELARFVATEGRGLSVRDQMRGWNARHPVWVETDPRNFANRARRAAELILCRDSIPRPPRG